MTGYVRASERLINEKLQTGWFVAEKCEGATHNNKPHTICYLVTRGNEKGFLKTFDFDDLRKSGDLNIIKRLLAKYTRELDMLKKCKENEISTVVKLIEHGTHFIGEQISDNRVDYFILEYSEDGNVLKCLADGVLNSFGAKFQAAVHLFDGLEQLHSNGIMHLDLKPENLMYFIKDRLTKITDFGSARSFASIFDDEIKDDVNSILTTRHYAPPECLYKTVWTNDWNEYRRKVDLYLAGSIIVKMFTNFTFTALLKESITDFYDWDIDVNHGKYIQYVDYLVKGSGKVYLIIEKELIKKNIESENRLSEEEIFMIMQIIRELCNPNAEQRGHPKEIVRKNNRDGLNRYRDKFFTLKNRYS